MPPKIFQSFFACFWSFLPYFTWTFFNCAKISQSPISGTPQILIGLVNNTKKWCQKSCNILWHLNLLLRRCERNCSRPPTHFDIVPILLCTTPFMLGEGTCILLNICQVTQLSCDDPDVASTEGCFQYFTAESGSFESFGLASSSMICGHNYNVCIRFENNSLHAKTNTTYT